MNQKLSVLVVALLAITMITAGCLGGDDETNDKDKDATADYEEMSGKIAPANGWAAANEQSVHTITAEGPIVNMEVTVTIQDSDEEHASSDQGSDPDKALITLSNGNASMSQEIVSGMSHKFKVPGGNITVPEGESLPSQWTITVKPTELGGGKPAYFFGFLVLNDQGVAWDVVGTYTYLEGGATAAPAEDE